VGNKSIIINKSYDPLILRTIIKRYSWWPFLFLVLFGLLAFFYLRYTKPIYESSMVIQLSNTDNAKDVLNIENVNTQENAISSVIELLRSEMMFQKAVKRLSLDVSLYSRGKVLTEEKYLSSSYYVQPYELNDSSLVNEEIRVSYEGDKVMLSYEKNGVSKEVTGYINEHIKNRDFDIVVKVADEEKVKEASSENELFFTFNNIESLSSRLKGGLTVMPLEIGAKTIEISFRGFNPHLCHDLTLAVSEAFIAYDEENQRRGSDNVLHFIDIQLDSLRSELKSSKDSLMLFQRLANLPDPESVSSQLMDAISDIEIALVNTDSELRSLFVVQEKLKNSPNRLEVYKLFPEMMGTSFESSLVKHINELHALLEEKDDRLHKGTNQNSRIKLLNKKIESKILLIQRSIEVIEERLIANAKVLRISLKENQNIFFQLPEKKMEYSRLKNVLDLNEKYFTLLTEKKVMYAISDAGYASSNRLLSRPKIEEYPVEPNINFIYSTFLIFGLLLGLGVMLLKYLTFNEINLLEDLVNILPEKASVLGGVPLFKYNMEYSQLIVAEAPKSSMAESMRKIRTNLSYIHPNYKTIAISSSISGEGKTFVALNLAGIIAMSGKKTVLLDLDLRKPKIHLGLNVENVNGMSSLIVEQATLDECIHKSELENFDFITAGPTPPNPSELLLSQQFKQVINDLKLRYDVIVIDNPPVGLVSDGVRNMTEADIPIYVFKSHFSKRSFTDRVKELFEVQQLKSLNVILNGIQVTKSTAYGYGYGYGYGSNYGNGYMEEETKVFKEAARQKKWYRRIFKRNGDN